MNPLLAVILPLLIAYALPLWWCIELWSLPEGYFAHGPLVPIVMATVIWGRRAQWRKTVAHPDPRGFWLLGPALLLHLVGAALTIDSLSAASLVFAVPGAAWVAFGRERLAGQWPVLWMFAFAVPMPIYVTDRVAFELKEIAVRGGVWLAESTGLAITNEGASLFVPGQTEALNVADPCGGLRSLLAMITLVYCIAFFIGPRTAWRRTLLMLAAAPIAVLVNLLRITAICWLAYFYGVEFATGTGHDVLNAVAWIVDLALVLAMDALLSRSRAARREGQMQPRVGEPAVLAAPTRSFSTRIGAVLWPMALVILSLSLTKPEADRKGRAAAIPTSVAGFVQKEQFAMTPRMFQLLGTDDAMWRRYEDGAAQTVFVVAVFHGSNWKSIHPPHICLLGSDMDIVEEGQVELSSGESDRAGRILLRTRRGGRPYLSLYAYGSRDLCTAGYFEFFLHHAPRALIRSTNDGFLLRVETYADGEGGQAAADARCEALLSQLVRQARGLLP
ncbi:MAG: exosortase/archaeosortase family protein [Planctomycetota bacterium]